MATSDGEGGVVHFRKPSRQLSHRLRPADEGDRQWLTPDHQRAVFPAELKLEEMRRVGIDHIVVSGGVCYQYPDQNDYLIEITQRYPDRITGLMQIDPYRPGTVEEIERCADAGLKGIYLSIGPWEGLAQIYPDLNICDAAFQNVWRKAERLRLPVQIDRDVVYSATWQARELEHIVESYDVPIVLMHMNELQPNFLQRLERNHEAAANTMSETQVQEEWWRSVEVARHPNVYLDLCNRPWKYHSYGMDAEWASIFRRLIELVGPGKILFGTDHLGPYNDDAVAFNKAFLCALDAESQELILGAAATKVFSLPN
jgi:predicted TIM-barrel fold metal-dependent hydrolase